MRNPGLFSVIIPTLQRSSDLPHVVDICARHPLVCEVLVINNAQEPLGFTADKVRVLQQQSNIYVNPAWNLGAELARGPLLAIINDDILFDAGVFDVAARALRRGLIGIIGPHPSCFTEEPRAARVGLRPAVYPDHFFGTCMFLRTKDFVPIPEDMLIWGGDDWLFFNARMPPAVLINARFSTDMSTTSRDPAFQRMHEINFAASMRHLGQVHPNGIGRGLEGKRWWHRVRRPYKQLLDLRHRWRRSVQT